MGKGVQEGRKRGTGRKDVKRRKRRKVAKEGRKEAKEGRKEGSEGRKEAKDGRMERRI